MKIGVIGSGDVGQRLASGFAAKGHEVKIGSRTPNSDKLKAWKKSAGSKASTGTFAETAQYGEVLVTATLGSAVEEAVKLAGRKNFNNKIVIDCTNPLDFSKGMPPVNFLPLTDSLGARIQTMLPTAKVVKCFNTVGNSQMINPKFKGAEMMICGNDAKAKQEVTKILKDFGWTGSIDIGGIENASWLEAMVPLWVRVGAALNTWDHMFQVAR